MKTYTYLSGMMLLLSLTFSGCASIKGKPEIMVIDPICNMKVSTWEGYHWKYNGKMYYFDSYTCKQTFKMNPEEALKKNNCSGK